MYANIAMYHASHANPVLLSKRFIVLSPISDNPKLIDAYSSDAVLHNRPPRIQYWHIRGTKTHSRSFVLVSDVPCTPVFHCYAQTWLYS